MGAHSKKLVNGLRVHDGGVWGPDFAAGGPEVGLAFCVSPDPTALMGPAQAVGPQAPHALRPPRPPEGRRRARAPTPPHLSGCRTHCTCGRAPPTPPPSVGHAALWQLRAPRLALESTRARPVQAEGTSVGARVQDLHSRQNCARRQLALRSTHTHLTHGADAGADRVAVRGALKRHGANTSSEVACAPGLRARHAR